jgi:hypothetical protein
MPAFMQVKPTHVLNAAGLTGRPNVDWCETHKVSQPAISDVTIIGVWATLSMQA